MSIAQADELVHPIGRALDPLVRGRFSPDSKRMVSRSAVLGTRSVPRTSCRSAADLRTVRCIGLLFGGSLPFWWRTQPLGKPELKPHVVLHEPARIIPVVSRDSLPDVASRLQSWVSLHFRRPQAAPAASPDSGRTARAECSRVECDRTCSRWPDAGNSM